MQHALQGGLSVGALLSLRFLTAAVALAALAWFMRLPWNRRAVLEGVWLGLILTVIFWLQVDGLRFTTTAKSAFITGLYVMFTPLVATIWGEICGQWTWRNICQRAAPLNRAAAAAKAEQGRAPGAGVGAAGGVKRNPAAMTAAADRAAAGTRRGPSKPSRLPQRRRSCRGPGPPARRRS